MLELSLDEAVKAVDGELLKSPKECHDHYQR